MGRTASTCLGIFLVTSACSGLAGTSTTTIDPAYYVL